VKVLLGASDPGGCGFYRMMEPHRVLSAAGCDVVLDIGVQTIQCVWDGSANVIDVDPVDADVVVLQRPLSSHLVQAIPIMQRHGTAVVVELDDDFWNMDKRNAAYRDAQPSTSPKRNYQWLTRACKMADLVTVSTPALARLVPTNKVRVLRNCVPEWYLHAEMDPKAEWSFFEKYTAIVGWTGSPMTHLVDLKALGDGLTRAVRNTGSVFFTIGSPDTGPLLGFNGGESAWTPWVEPIDNYPGAIKGFDVGVVPLRMGLFNDAKSYIKGLEYASVGVPFVASAAPEYKYLAKMGAGDIAAERHDWEKKIRRLIDHVDYRQERREEGLLVATERTYENNAWLWWEAWGDALANYKEKKK